MPILQPTHGLLGRQNAKGAGALTCFGQLEDQVVAADQQVGVAGQRQFQKHLVIRVAAFGQPGCVRRNGLRDKRHLSAVSVKQPLLPGCIEFELFVAHYTHQFRQRWLIGQANHRAGFNRCHQRGEWRRPEMKQIYHHIRIEHQAGRGDVHDHV